MLQVFFFYSIALANKILKLMQKSEIESKSIKRHSSINLFAIKITDICYSSFDMTRQGNARGGNSAKQNSKTYCYAVKCRSLLTLTLKDASRFHKKFIANDTTILLMVR